jgi:hypothetical protein
MALRSRGLSRAGGAVMNASRLWGGMRRDEAWPMRRLPRSRAMLLGLMRMKRRKALKPLPYRLGQNTPVALKAGASLYSQSATP